MKIILVGSGKVGTALARQLSEEGHNVTVVDTNKARVEHLIETIPHIEMCKREFVLEPLSNIAGYKRHPVNGKTIRELLDELERNEE